MAMRDPGGLARRRALRVAICVPLVFLIGSRLLNLGSGALYATFAVFALLVFADFGGPLPQRGRAYVACAGAGLVAIALGTVLAENRVAAVGGTFIVAFGLFFAAVLRGYFAASTIAVLLPFVIAVTNGPGYLPQLASSEIGWLTGAAVATAAALVLWPTHLREDLRLRIGVALHASAVAVRAAWGGELASRSIDVDARIRDMNLAFQQVHEVYDGKLIRPGGATSRDRALMQLVDQLGRMRTLLLWRVSDIPIAPIQPDVKLARLAADCIDECVTALTVEANPPDPARLDQARDRHREEIEAWANDQLRQKVGSVAIMARLDAGFQVRSIASMAEMACASTGVAVGHRRSGPTTEWRIAEPLLSTTNLDPRRMLRDHLSMGSPWFRNSLRSGAAVALAVAVALLTDVSHGFWVVLGAVSALRFDALGTGKSALRVILGTIGGFSVSLLLLVTIGPHLNVYWILLPLTAFFAAYAPAVISLAVGQGAFTVFVLVFFALAYGPDIKTGEIRLMDVGLGLIVSLLMSAMLWPRGVSAQVVTTLKAALLQCSEFLIASYDRLLEGPSFEVATQHSYQAATTALSKAVESFDLSLSQAAGPKAVDPQTWAVLANGAVQLQSASQVVWMLSRLGYKPSRCPEAVDVLFATAHHVRSHFVAIVDKISTLDQGKVRIRGFLSETPLQLPEVTNSAGANPLTEPVSRLRHRVLDCLESWEPDESPDTGRSLLALIWARDWLILLDWVVHRTEQLCDFDVPEDRPAAGSQAGAPDPPPATGCVHPIPKSD